MTQEIFSYTNYRLIYCTMIIYIFLLCIFFFIYINIIIYKNIFKLKERNLQNKRQEILKKFNFLKINKLIIELEEICSNIQKNQYINLKQNILKIKIIDILNLNKFIQSLYILYALSNKQLTKNDIILIIKIKNQEVFKLINLVLQIIQNYLNCPCTNDLEKKRNIQKQQQKIEYYIESLIEWSNKIEQLIIELN